MEYPIRHALIIAAGSGMRFGKAAQCRPKPLLEVAGIPLIRRTLETARKAGLDQFTVVTGYCAEKLENFLRQELSGDMGIRTVRNAKWDRPNGLSVLQAKGYLPEPFVLLMADHLFDAGILRELLVTPLSDGHCRLAVDFHPESILDLADSTKVEVIDGNIVNIGKELDTYNGIDTGIFLCSHQIFAALETAVLRGEENLSDGIQELARRRLMEAMDIGRSFWHDIDDEASLREGERRLRQIRGDADPFI